jgi:hypothetical protein
MKVVSIILLIASAQSVWATDLEQIRRTASFEASAISLDVSAAGLDLAVAAPARAQQEDGFVWRREFCWARGKEVHADRMGMPANFCVNSMRLVGDIEKAPQLELQASAMSGTYSLKLGPLCDGFRKATARIFDRTPMIMVCAAAESAYIEYSILIDERGKIVSDPETKSFYGTTQDTCSNPWNFREIQYEMKNRI